MSAVIMSRPIAQIQIAIQQLWECHRQLQGRAMLPLSVDQASDLVMVRDGIQKFCENAHNGLQILRDSKDTLALSQLRHDLNNDLNVVIGFSQILVREIPPPFTPAQFRSLETSIKTGRLLIQLLDQIR